MQHLFIVCLIFVLHDEFAESFDIRSCLCQHSYAVFIIFGTTCECVSLRCRSRPIIRINSKLSVLPELIDLERPNCLLRDNSNATWYVTVYSFISSSS